MLDLPAALRAELKDPIGPVYTDAAVLLEEAGRPLVAVGDVVTDHLLRETVPDVALVDGMTKRTAIDEAVDRSAFDREVHVENPAATLSEPLLETLVEALDGDESTVIVVEGEEDLAAVPAVAVAPDGASVVYGQPDEGMVLVTVGPGTRATMRDVLARMEGDRTGAWRVLGIDPDFDHDATDG